MKFLFSIFVFTVAINSQAFETFDVTPLVTESQDEILTFSCREKGKTLDCLRSRVNLHKDKDNCNFSNIVISTQFTKVSKNTWSVDLPIRVDTLKKDGAFWTFTEAEKKDNENPKPRITVYSNKSPSNKKISCSNINFTY